MNHRHQFPLRLPFAAALIALLLPTALLAADGARSPDGVWTAVTDQSGAFALAGPAADGVTLPEAYRVFSLAGDDLAKLLAAAPAETKVPAADSDVVLALPMPDGSYARFRVSESPFLGPEMQKQLPDFRSYVAQGLDDPAAAGRLDFSPYGFHALIRAPQGMLAIDPWSPSRTDLVRAAWDHDYAAGTGAYDCLTKDADLGPAGPVDQSITPTGAQLRTYRLEITCTDEYMCYFDPAGCANGALRNPAAALAAVATAVNRVNTVYEAEAAVRFQLVQTLHWWTPGGSDPFPNGMDTNAAIEVNRTVANSVVGVGNYDIGHVFTTAVAGNDNGVAYIGAVCNASYKAGGASAAVAPTGDLFSVRLVCHEMGHQFSSYHTWTNGSGCYGVNQFEWQVEPGSGSTIMGYAGICSLNVQPVADFYFHVKSLEAISAFRNVAGCGTVVATGNSPPVADAGPDVTIPRNTPFYLNGAATDPDGDALTYTWEQYDSQASLFRSVPPSPYGYWRYMPDWDQMFGGGGGDPWEVLPATDRTMHFRLTARDNRAGGGGVDDDETVVTVAGDPFYVTYPNGGETFDTGQPVNVTWNVGGGSAAASVTAWLWTGIQFTWLGQVPNTGSYTFTMPCGISSSTCRVWLEAATASGLGAHFLDVSNADFTLVDGLPDFRPALAPGWADMIVVNSIASGALPTSLAGETPTYVYYAFGNANASWGCGTFEDQASIDEQVVASESMPSGPGPGVGWYGPGSMPVVAGGRHTAWVMTDPNGLIPESNEANNGYARQWVWQPMVMSPGMQVTRTHPPLDFAGHEWLPSGVTHWSNVDGLRLTTSTGWWKAAAVSTTNPAQDTDLYYYTPSAGVEDGFTTPLFDSSAGGAYTDILITNCNLVPNLVRDVGLRNWSSSTTDCSFEYRQSDATLLMGDEFLRDVAAGQMVRMEEAYIGFGQTGTVTFELKSGEADQPLLLAVLEPGFTEGSVYLTSHGVQTDATGRALLTFNASSAGYYGVVVFRHGFEGTSPFRYTLKLWSGTANPVADVPTPAGLPAVSRIEAVYPNPFNPQTKVLLAMHEAGPVTVRVYDVQGRLVRTLHDGALAAGRHELPWNGTDDAGRAAPSGVYFVRMAHAGGVDQQRLSLVK